MVSFTLVYFLEFSNPTNSGLYYTGREGRKGRDRQGCIFDVFHFLNFPPLRTVAFIIRDGRDGRDGMDGAYLSYFNFFEFSTPTNRGLYYTGRDRTGGTGLTGRIWCIFHFFEFFTPTNPGLYYTGRDGTGWGRRIFTFWIFTSLRTDQLFVSQNCWSPLGSRKAQLNIRHGFPRWFYFKNILHKG